MLPVQNLLQTALADLLAQVPFSEGKLQFAWTAAVGPAVARVTTVTMGEGRRVVVRTAGPLWSREVERSLPVIRERLATFLGAGVIGDIEILDR